MNDYKAGDMPPTGYLAWHDWAKVQADAGLRQEQCDYCFKWRFPQELKEVLDKETFKKCKEGC
jgi:hypothetical protein